METANQNVGAKNGGEATEPELQTISQPQRIPFESRASFVDEPLSYEVRAHVACSLRVHPSGARNHTQRSAYELGLCQHGEQRLVRWRSHPFLRTALDHGPVTGNVCDVFEQLELTERCVTLNEALIDEAPDHLRRLYEYSASQARGDRDVIARFGRHPHRNALLGREPTPEELEYIATRALVHNRPLPR